MTNYHYRSSKYSARAIAHASVAVAVFRKPIFRRDQRTDLVQPTVSATRTPDSSSALHL
jgi:hypothetical protein